MPAIPPKPKPAGDNRNLVTVDANYAAPGLEDHLRLFWEKNGRALFTVILAIAVIIVGRGFYRLSLEHRAEAVQADYGAATTDSQLKDFIAANPADPLAGLAQLRLADGAYTAGNFAEAQSAYTKALLLLTGTALAPRAQLGAAVAQLQAGQADAATTALKAIADSSTLPKATRAEAAYDLAAIAAAAGRTNDVIRLTLQIATIDPGSPFASRGSELLMRTTTAAPTPAAGAPVSSSAPTPAPVSAPTPPAPSNSLPAVVFPAPAH